MEEFNPLQSILAGLIVCMIYIGYAYSQRYSNARLEMLITTHFVNYGDSSSDYKAGDYFVRSMTLSNITPNSVDAAIVYGESGKNNTKYYSTTYTLSSNCVLGDQQCISV